MDEELRKDSKYIIDASLKAVMHGEAVKRALLDFRPGKGKTILISVGKAAFSMAEAAVTFLNAEDTCSDYEHDNNIESIHRKGRISDGIVITKYGHVCGDIPGIRCFEAGHPVPDENGFKATQEVLDLVSDLTDGDTVLFLLSGGGSALFEKTLISPYELMSITRQLLASGADITEVNTIRKRLSAVKGGRFARTCSPAKVFQIVLSDIVGDPLDMIASGPACADMSTCSDAREIAEKYGLRLSDTAERFLAVETVKKLDNVETHITGSVRELCRAAEGACRSLGYETVFLADRLSCEAKDAGIFISDIVKTYEDYEGFERCDNCGECDKKLAFIAGGETVVHLNEERSGLGGRNQELALAAAEGISGVKGSCVFSVGSDGTDGPTDAAGGYVDHSTMADAERLGVDIPEALRLHDSYHALESLGGLMITGPTGTNVNDVTIALMNQGK